MRIMASRREATVLPNKVDGATALKTNRMEWIHDITSAAAGIKALPAEWSVVNTFGAFSRIPASSVSPVV